jgi:hypothetical protein
MGLQWQAGSDTLGWQVFSNPPRSMEMTTRNPHKLNMNVPAGYERGLRGAASKQTATGAGVTNGSLAERCTR